MACGVAADALAQAPVRVMPLDRLQAASNR
jgi:hypothetical protein